MTGPDPTPRQRVRLALQHQPTDRVPVDFLATPECWANLQQHLGLNDEESVLRRLGIDVRQPRLRYVGPPLPSSPDGSYRDAWGLTWSPVRHEGGAYYEVTHHPLGAVTDASQVADHAWPDPDWWDVGCMAEQIQAWDREAEYAIALPDFGDPGGFWEVAAYLRGMEQILLDTVLNPEIPFEIMRHVAQVMTVLLERALGLLGDRVDLIWTSDDIAHQHGLMVSLPTLRELILPHHQQFNRRVHELGSRVMFHTCGAAMGAIPDLIAAGVDVLDVLQFSADHMAPLDLKLAFGDRLCFHGGVDVQQMLPRATPDEVHRTVTGLIDVLGKGGGYILSPTHNIQVDTPAANIVAVYRAAGSLAAPPS